VGAISPRLLECFKQSWSLRAKHVIAGTSGRVAQGTGYKRFADSNGTADQDIPVGGDPLVISELQDYLVFGIIKGGHF